MTLATFPVHAISAVCTIVDKNQWKIVVLHAGSPFWWLLFEVVAVIAATGWIVLLFMLRSKRRIDELMQRYRADCARLQLRVQTLERGTTTIPTPPSRDYLDDAVRFCERQLETLPRSDPHYIPMQWRLRALRSEALARETQHFDEQALPIVMPAYTPPSGRRAIVAGKEAQLLREKLNDAEIEIARLKTIESLYNDLRAAVIGQADRGVQITRQLHEELKAQGADDNTLSLLQMLQNSYTEMQKLMEKADSHTPLTLPTDLRLALEQGARLQAALLHDQDAITALRDHVNVGNLNDIENKEIQELRAQLKSQHNQLRESMMCIDTLENNLSEAQTLLKKFIDRARRYQDQEARIAILDARCKQGDKDLRMLAQINKQLDGRCQQLNLQMETLAKGGDPAVQLVQTRFVEKQQEMERLNAEKSMLEEQVLALDAWRDRAEQAEAHLKRALTEKQMLEDYFAETVIFEDDNTDPP